MYIRREYKEAKKSDERIKEVQKVETARWRINIGDVQQRELERIEEEQKDCFSELVKKWDYHLRNHDYKAHASLARFKHHQHTLLTNYTHLLHSKLKTNFSPTLHQMRQQEHHLLHLQLFLKAQQAKHNADQFQKVHTLYTQLQVLFTTLSIDITRTSNQNTGFLVEGETTLTNIHAKTANLKTESIIKEIE